MFVILLVVSGQESPPITLAGVGRVRNAGEEDRRREREERESRQGPLCLLGNVTPVLVEIPRGNSRGR